MPEDAIVEVPTFDLTPDVHDSQSVVPEGEQHTDQVDTQIPIDQQPDEWFVIPENLDQTAQLDWYKERFDVINQTLRPSQETLAPYLEPHFAQMIQEKESELSGFVQMYQAMQTNPKAFLAQFIPEALQSLGVNPVLSQEEIFNQINSRLISEFGAEWQQIAANSADRYNPNSNAYRIDYRYQQMLNELQQQNRRNQEIMGKWNELVSQKQIQMPDEQQQAESINRLYSSEFEGKGFSREQFDDFIRKAEQTTLQPADIHHAIYFDEYMKQAYQKGIEAGKNGNYQSAVRAGGREITPNSTNIPSSDGSNFLRGYEDAIRRGIF